MKTCEICDRPIRTGRKYCWEHRRTAQAETLRGDEIIETATEAYIKFRLLSIQNKIYSSMLEYHEVEEKAIHQINTEILNRDPKYVKWVKSWVQDEREEKEFRKSLLK